MSVTRWRFAAIYISAAVACWALGHAAGIRNGTNGSLAAGYGGGLIVTVIVLLARRRWWPTRRAPRRESPASESDLNLEDFDLSGLTWPFEVLGVPVEASAQEIRRAHRALVQRFHPDYNQGDAGANERFLAVQAAYEELGSP